jgi:hypothetical protein
MDHTAQALQDHLQGTPPPLGPLEKTGVLFLPSPFPPCPPYTGSVGSAVGAAHGLLVDSEAAYHNAVNLHDLALSLEPQIDQLQANVKQLLALLLSYPQAKGRETIRSPLLHPTCITPSSSVYL